MARKEKIRISYQNDAVVIRRIMNAVRKDPARPLAWKTQLVAALSRAIILMQEDIMREMAKEAEPYDKTLAGGR